MPLVSTVQRYDWGDLEAIPRLLGHDPDGAPYAELWLGAHPSAPSVVTVDDGGVPLDVLVRSAPAEAVGARVSDLFGPRLPYLLKVLAARKALSLQVHPKPHAARAGFNRENRAGLPQGSPQRSFHDNQHKPEMVVALSQFEGLAGFRSPRTILSLLDGLDGALVGEVRDVLRADRTSGGIRSAFTRLLTARAESAYATDIKLTVESVRERVTAGSPYDRADRTVLDLALQHPADPAVIISLMLNRVTLEPGEATFIPSGVVHAYLSGLAVEVMASSDNVLRAGLTTKLVDERALLECATFEPGPPITPTITTAGTRGQVQTYRAPVSEFALTLADVDASGPVSLAADGPRIMLVLDGQVTLHWSGGEQTVGCGASVFVPHAAGDVKVSGAGHVVSAWVP